MTYEQLNGAPESSKKKKKETSIHKRSGQQDIIKLSTEINKLKTKRSIQRINENKSWLFEENKKDRPTPTQTKKRRKTILIKKIRNENRDTTKETKEIQRLIRYTKKPVLHRIGKSK